MKFKILYLVLAVIAATVAFCFIPFKVSKGKMKIKCHYMAYACGDCYPQYHVDSIIKGEAMVDILGTDLLLVFNKPGLETSLEEQTWRCKICYDFYLTGELKKSVAKGNYFVVERGGYKMRFKECCQYW